METVSNPSAYPWLNADKCKAFEYLYAHYPALGDCAGATGKYAGGQAVTREQAIGRLNPAFAVQLYNMMSKQPSLMINSAYRLNTCTNSVGDGANKSNHKIGCAVDLSYDTNDPCRSGVCLWVKTNAPQSGLHLRLLGSAGEANHLEPQNIAACQAGGTTVPPIVPGTPVAGNSSQSMCAQQYASNPAAYAACVQAYQKIDNQLNNPNYNLSSLFGGNNKTTACFRYTGSTYIPASCSISSGGLNSLFGGNSSLGQMMQGMQLGQGLGSSLFGGSGSSNPTPSAPAPSYYNPLMPPPIPVQTSDVTQPPPGSSAIDQLIATLGSTTANPNTANPPNTNISVATNSVGVVQQPSNGISNLSNMSSSSIAQMQQQIIDLNGQLNAATTSIAFASSTGNTPAIVGALNSIGVALSAIGQFFANIFTPGATTTP